MKTGKYYKLGPCFYSFFNVFVYSFFYFSICLFIGELVYQHTMTLDSQIRAVQVEWKVLSGGQYEYSGHEDPL